MATHFLLRLLCTAAAVAVVVAGNRPAMGDARIRHLAMPTGRVAQAIGLHPPRFGSDDSGSAACPSPPPLSPLPATLPAATQKALDDLNTVLQTLFQDAAVTGGAATLVYDQEVLRTFTYGTTREDGGGSPVTGDTVFRLGSNTKVFTTAMLYLLRDAGKVSLDQQVTDVYPSYLPKPYPGSFHRASPHRPAQHARGATAVVASPAPCCLLFGMLL